MECPNNLSNRWGADGDITKEKFREKVANLDARKAAAERELGKLEAGAEHVERLEALPGLVEAYLTDLPYLVGWEPVMRDYELVGHGYEPGVHPRTLTPESIKFLSKEALAEKKRAAERARAERFRRIYETLELKVVAYLDGTLDVSGKFGVGSARLTPGEGAEERCRDERGQRRTRS